MRLPPDGFFIPRRGAYLKGLGVWRWQGDKLYFQRAPRKQPTPRTDAEAFNRSTLYWSTQVVKIMDAYQREFSSYMSRNSQLAAQDFMYISLFGRVGHLVRRDGTKVFSMAAMQDVSQLLDALYQLKGGILVRGDTWWEGLAIGDPGKVLGVTSPGELGFVDQTPAFAGHTDEWMQPPPMSPSTNSTNFGGNAFAAIPIYPNDAFNLAGVRVWMSNAGSGHTAYAGLYKAPSSSPILTGATKIAQGTAQTLVPGLNSLPFNSAAPVTQRDWYWLGLTILGAGNVNMAARDYNRSLGFFAQTTGTLPNTAPTATLTSGNSMSQWGY